MLLGIAGREVDRETLRALADGKCPGGGALVRHRKQEGCLSHRAAWDATFSAPKTVSMAAVGGGDERLLSRFQEACDRGLRELETCARARAGAGRDLFRETANLTVSSFTHAVNRNGEPHLHNHGVVYNFTFDALAGGWRALETSAMFAAVGRITAIHRADVANALRQLGYDVTVDEKGCPQIAGISPASQAGCSTRSEEVKLAATRIRARAEGRGVVWSEKLESQAREWAAKQTRKAKPCGLDMTEVRARCLRVCAANGDDVEGVVREARRRELGRTPEELKAEAERGLEAVSDALDMAVLHHLERESVFSAEDLETHCLTQHKHIGLFDVDDVRAEVGRRVSRGLLLCGVGPRGETLYTTKGVLAAEENQVALVWQGRGRFPPLGSEEQVRLTASLEDRNGNAMNSDQAKAFAFLALSRDQITGLHGKAGVGKSFVFAKLSQLAALQGVTTRAFAPTLPAAETLKTEGLPAETLQSFLQSKPSRPGAPELWLLDEAGMVGAADMEAFLKRAKGADARVVLAGDTRQFGSVPAGRSFADLLRRGLRAVELTKVIRQDRSPAPVKRAVEMASEGETLRALIELDRAGRVHESPDPRGRVAAAARLHASFLGEALVVCATNRERREVNQAVRGLRKQRGEVEAKGLHTEVYLRKSLSKASRREATHYEKGDVVRFTRVRDERLRPGVWYRVVGRDLAKNLVTVKGPDGRRVTYSPLDHHAIDDVFRAERREFAVGDVVELKGKDRRLGLSPGQVGTVVSADRKGKALTVKARGGATRRVELGRYKTLDHAYASTGHSAQSRTVENVILLQTGGHRKEVVNRASLYVGASRTRGELHLVVDDLACVSRDLTREHKKVTALDIVPTGKAGLGLSLSLCLEPGDDP